MANKQQTITTLIIISVLVVDCLFRMMSTITGCQTTKERSSLSLSLSIEKRAALDSKMFLAQKSFVGRVYRKWDYSQHPFPCYPCEDKWYHQEQLPPSQTGLLFVRNLKTGSSTVGGVALRIARAMKRRAPTINTTMCQVRYDHGSALDQKFGARIHNQSYLFSFVRDPTKRAISEFFHFGVSVFKQDPSDAAFTEFFRVRPTLNNFFLGSMSLEPFDAATSNKSLIAASIMEGYDFIGITERMDESLVVLKILLDLDYNDILYLSAKKHGTFDDGGRKGKRCSYIVPSFLSDGMKEWLRSNEWQQMIDGDMILFRAANQSLEKTMEALGREQVYRQVQEFKKLQKVATEKCMPTTVFPCQNGSEHRYDHSCLWRDLGCGYHCLEESGLGKTKRI